MSRNPVDGARRHAGQKSLSLRAPLRLKPALIVADVRGVPVTVVRRRRPLGTIPTADVFGWLVIVDDKGTPRRLGPSGFDQYLLIDLVRRSSVVFLQTSAPDLSSYRVIAGIAEKGCNVLSIETGPLHADEWRAFADAHRRPTTAIDSQGAPRRWSRRAGK